MLKTTFQASTNKAWWWLTIAIIYCATLASALPTLLDKRQAPNQMYIYDPTDQTGSLNMTTFILPIPLADAYSIASPYSLILNHGLPSSVIPSPAIEVPLEVPIASLSSSVSATVQNDVRYGTGRGDQERARNAPR